MNDVELWKDIPDWEGIYQASNQGRLRRLDRVDKVLGYSRVTKGGLLKICWTSSSKYGVVNLLKEGKKKSKLAHVLIATTWIKNPDNKPFVNHKDGDKFNIHPSNLEWSTKSENNKHAYDAGLRGRKNKIPKIKCPYCKVPVGSNMLKRHIEAKHR